MRVRNATGLTVTKSGLSSFAATLDQRQQLGSTLRQQNHSLLQAQLQAPAESWQAAIESTAPAPMQNLGTPAPLPTSFGGGSASGASVVAGVHGPDHDNDDDMGGYEDDDFDAGGGKAGGGGGAAYRERERKRMNKKRAGNPAVRRKEATKKRWKRAVKNAESEGGDPPEWADFQAAAEAMAAAAAAEEESDSL